jgi:hypothetical protein
VRGKPALLGGNVWAAALIARSIDRAMTAAARREPFARGPGDEGAVRISMLQYDT